MPKYESWRDKSYSSWNVSACAWPLRMYQDKDCSSPPGCTYFLEFALCSEIMWQTFIKDCWSSSKSLLDDTAYKRPPGQDVKYVHEINTYSVVFKMVSVFFILRRNTSSIIQDTKKVLEIACIGWETVLSANNPK